MDPIVSFDTAKLAMEKDYKIIIPKEELTKDEVDNTDWTISLS